MNYEETLAYLESLGKFGIRLGMERIEWLLRELGDPQRQLKTVHVTGTNGKGSVTGMIADIFKCSGLKTGKFISPHLVRYNERFSINGEEISDADLAEVLTDVREAADSIVAKGVCEQPTQFEVLTAAGFLWFFRQKTDYAVIEVGLGGLWDSTNVIVPEVSVITNVQLDHTDRCGKDLAHIAYQKAGIIKDGVPVVTAAQGDDALAPVRITAMFKEAPIYEYGKTFWAEELASSMEEQSFLLRAGDYCSAYKIHLAGEHQLINASVAIVAAKLVSKKDERITEAALHEGVAATVWPGRLELVRKDPVLILDGAHNPDGALALRRSLDKYYPERKRYFIFGMMGDKDMASVIKNLLRPEDTVYTVRADSGARAAGEQELAHLIGDGANAEPSLTVAYDKAVAAAGSQGIICVCGSLYLVGEFKKMLLENRERLN